MAESKNYDFLRKILLLGEGGVGKTSIINRYIHMTFSDQYFMTIGAQFAVSIIHVKKFDKRVKLSIWDLAGEQRFNFVQASYFKGLKGTFVVFDVTNRRSFKMIPNWLNAIKTNTGGDPVIFLIGNKIDLNDRVVSREEAEEFAKQHNLEYYETSAKEGIGINEIFETMALRLVEKWMSENV